MNLWGYSWAEKSHRRPRSKCYQTNLLWTCIGACQGINRNMTRRECSKRGFNTQKFLLTESSSLKLGSQYTLMIHILASKGLMWLLLISKISSLKNWLTMDRIWMLSYLSQETRVYIILLTSLDTDWTNIFHRIRFTKVKSIYRSLQEISFLFQSKLEGLKII